MRDPLGSLWLPGDPATIPIWRPGDPPWPELLHGCLGGANIGAKVRVARLAERQAGRVETSQLAAMGLVRDQTWRWAGQGFLIPELPRVYAVGHGAHSVISELTAALLYAGRGAMFDALAAGWWVGAIRDRPARISISGPRRCRSIETGGDRTFAGIDVHCRHALEPRWIAQDGGRLWGEPPQSRVQMPITPIPQLLLDLAVILDRQHMRWALANLEYRRLLDYAETWEACGRGRPGSTNLKQAFSHHLPILGKLKSRGEVRLIFLLEDHGVRLPDDANVWIHGIQVDTLCLQQRVIVEIDGEGNHGETAQGLRDVHRDQVLRSLGYIVLRFDAQDLIDNPGHIAAEIAAVLAARA